MTKGSGVRLFVILARRAPVGVIFRRGPSKQALLIRWDAGDVRFEQGQWFKGRIYERRCDLSPSGGKLIYFAAKFKGPLHSWTAVSRPPYLTALALWPKGDTWNGGGLFASETVIMLNHGPIAEPPAQGRIPRGVLVKPLNLPPGEDDSIYHRRLVRDGWRLVHEGTATYRKDDRPMWITIDPPTLFVNAQPAGSRGRVRLEMRIVGFHERGGPWELTEYRVVNDERILLDLGRTDWADWDRGGDLLFARDGRLYRLHRADLGRSEHNPADRAVEIADFRGLRFAEKAPPPAAVRW